MTSLKSLCITYRKGYKYQLSKDYSIEVDVYAPKLIDLQFLRLDEKGLLLIKSGYAWDGVSGGPDWQSMMRGSLVHDAFYQLLREGCLPQLVRQQVDAMFLQLCCDDGLSVPLAWGAYQVVRKFGGAHAAPAAKKEVVHAPEGCWA